MILVSATAAGCDFLSTEPAQEGEGGQNNTQDGQGGGAGSGKGKEAPMLAEMVERGELPPVEERLPDEPMVVEPVDRVGVYGGEWNTAMLGPADAWFAQRATGYENLVRWQPEVSSFSAEETIPNVVESWESNDEGTEYTFSLRQGVKWSDGEPFTADDVVFAQQDFYNNEELIPARLYEATAEKVDDYTVRFLFEEPDALFITRQLATPLALFLTSTPRHYMEQFHKEYNPDVQSLVEKEGASDWVTLFENKHNITQNSELPVINPWVIKTPVGEGNRVVLERNPYYWKVDPDGSQLPYIDRLILDVVSEEEIMITKTLNGEMDMHFRHFNVPRNKPVLAQNRDRGNYKFFDLLPSSMNTVILALNLAHQDATKREIYQNRDFRIGLSHAIDRQEIIDVVYQGQGEPWQAAPRPESPYHNEEFAKQYTEYSVEQANQALDRAGYTERGGNNIRLGPDGNPIVVTVEFTTEIVPEFPDVLELIQGFWREVGIEMNIKNENRSLFYERKAANQHDAGLWKGDGGLEVVLEPRWYFPHSGESIYAVPWAEWFSSNRESGQEPPEPARQQIELYYQLQEATDSNTKADIMGQILQIAQEQFWVMGINLPPSDYGIVKNNFHNVLGGMPDAYLYPTPGPTNPEQYFISDE